MNELVTHRTAGMIVAEYEEKKERLADALKKLEQCEKDFMLACTIGGTYGRQHIKLSSVYPHVIEKNLLVSAWLNFIECENIRKVMTAKDLQEFERALQDPPPFTKENIAATLGKYKIDPRQQILRGLAEVFCSLDQKYKSHDRVRIGVEKLPKRVIINNFSKGFDGKLRAYNYAFDRLHDLLRALTTYMKCPLPDRNKIEEAMNGGENPFDYMGLSFRPWNNGNLHVYFNKYACTQINKGLAEYYGDALGFNDEKPETKQTSTAVAKDLQFYPTPHSVIETLARDVWFKPETKILEPSAGDGRMVEYVLSKGSKCIGYEVDPTRVSECRAKDLPVIQANFLDIVPTPEFDYVLMNPPFYGKHYAKHVRHALKFLKDGGKLISILPITARYDHMLLKDLNGSWQDLPVGAFSESGTNVNTTILSVRKR